MRVILLAIVIVSNSLVTAMAAADSLGVETSKEFKEYSIPFVDRIAVRTNALDWMLTIPNIAFEYDLKNSQYNDLTIGLSAKYNWNSWHYNKSTERIYCPPTVYNLLDIRPEFRYWYRVGKNSTGKGKWKKYLKNSYHSKESRAYYLGAYANYSTYTFKFGKKGMQGVVYGLGVTAGYDIPMYEYDNGSIDVELGASLGMQMCTRDMFFHNPDGFFYTQVLEGTKPLHVTPFPVVSDLRVAFVWRHKSIKDKIELDREKLRVERVFKINEVDYNYDDYSKANYDEGLANTMHSREREQYMANDSLYRKGYMDMLDSQEATLRGFVPMVFSEEFKVDPRINQIVEEYEEKLYKLIVKRKKEAIRRFEREWAEEKSNRAKQQKPKKEKPAKAENTELTE